jgi:hypothetical protein
MEAMTMQMLSGNKRNVSLNVLGTFILVVTAVTFAALGELSHAKTAGQRSMSQETFKSPEAAVEALVNAVKTNDEKELKAILGPAGTHLVSSGDPVADQQGRARFLQRYEEKNRLVNGSERKVILELGKESWPLPIPIVMKDGTWLFDTKAGRDEILNRRIGRNELNAIQVCLAYVDAQREYADIMRVTEGRRKYAQKFLSEPGKKDGLYWKTEESEQQSPLGPLVAAARKEGYRKNEGNQPTPYHGYIYKILKAQGRHAPRGGCDYVVGGNMIAGFALVARPANYGASGMMTFIVSDDGVVYEKNLGKNTEAVVQKLNRFDPDKTWRKVDAKSLRPPGKGD